jgi:hypothetical protein
MEEFIEGRVKPFHQTQITVKSPHKPTDIPELRFKSAK